MARPLNRYFARSRTPWKSYITCSSDKWLGVCTDPTSPLSQPLKWQSVTGQRELRVAPYDQLLYLPWFSYQSSHWALKLSDWSAFAARVALNTAAMPWIVRWWRGHQRQSMGATLCCDCWLTAGVPHDCWGDCWYGARLPNIALHSAEFAVTVDVFRDRVDQRSMEISHSLAIARIGSEALCLCLPCG